MAGASDARARRMIGGIQVIVNSGLNEVKKTADFNFGIANVLEIR